MPNKYNTILHIDTAYFNAGIVYDVEMDIIAIAPIVWWMRDLSFVEALSYIARNHRRGWSCRVTLVT